MKELNELELREVEGGILLYILGGLLWDFLSDPGCVGRGWANGCKAAEKYF